MSNYFQNDDISVKSVSSSSSSSSSSSICNLISSVQIYLNAFNDKLVSFRKARWYVIICLSLIYLIRLFLTKGYQALTYCIGIHFLNSFIGFISPIVDPEDDAINFDTNTSSSSSSYLPQNNSEEFKPFQRKVKEFHLWEAMFYTLVVSNIITFFPVFDIPVYWPLLLFYFVIVFILTMKHQIKQMMKYNYLPWDVGKVQYNTS